MDMRADDYLTGKNEANVHGKHVVSQGGYTQLVVNKSKVFGEPPECTFFPDGINPVCERSYVCYVNTFLSGVADMFSVSNVSKQIYHIP